MKSLLLVSRFVSLGLFLHGQEADKTAIIVETISIEEPVPAESKVLAKIEPILKSSKKRESSSSKTRKSSKPSHTVVNPPAEFLKKPIKGVVIFRDEKWREFRTISDKTGKYEIRLPYGKYSVYSTPDPACWMYADYSNSEFLVDKGGKTSLDIVLRSHPIIE